MIVVVVLAVLVFIAPYVAATGPVTRAIVSAVSDDLQGTVRIDDLSLGWLGPVRVSGLTVTDPEGREVLRAKSATIDRGLLGLATSPTRFKLATIDSPSVVLYVAEDGTISLAKAFESTPEAAARRKPKDEDEPPPQPRGDVVINGGQVRIVRPDGRELTVTDIDTTVHVKGLAAIDGELALATPGSGKVRTVFEVTGLSDGKDIDPAQAAVSLTLETLAPVELKPVVAFATGRTDVMGRVEIAGDGEVSTGRRSGSFTVKLHRLQTPTVGRRQVNPLDATAIGSLTDDGRDIAGEIDLAVGAAGSVAAKGQYRRADGGETIDWGETLSAVLAGQPVRLPQLIADVDGWIELPKLADAVPGLLRLREDVEVVNGRIVIDKVRIRGGISPPREQGVEAADPRLPAGASGRIELTELTVLRGGERQSYEPIVASFDLAMPERKGLEIRDAQLQSAFVRAQASGTPTDLDAQFAADLDRLHERLAGVFELGGFRMAGALNGSAKIARADDGALDVSMTATGSRVKVGRGERMLDVASGLVSQKGRLILSDGRVRRVEITEASVNFDDAVSAVLTGAVDLPSGAFAADVRSARADLAYAGRQADALGIDQLKRYAGTVSLAGKASWTGGDAPIATDGSAEVTDLAVDGKALSSGKGRVEWSGVQAAADGRSLQAESAKATLDFAHFSAKGLKVTRGPTPAADGQVDLRADVARCLSAIAPIVKWKKPPQVSGIVAASGTVITSAGRVQFEGPLTVTAPGGTDKLVQAEFSGRIDTSSKSFDAEAKVARVDLAYVTEQLRALEIEGLPTYAGVAAANVNVARAPDTGTIRTSGAATAAGIRIGGEPIGEDKVVARWTDVVFDPDEKAFQAKTVSLDSLAAKLTAEGVSGSLGEQPAFTGRLDASADMDRCIAIARLHGVEMEPGNATARATLSGRAETTDRRIGFDGTVAVEPLSAAADRQALSAAAKGWFDPSNKAFQADVTVDRADLGWIAARAGGFGFDQLTPYAGVVKLTAKASQGGAGKPIEIASVDASVTGLAVDGKPVGEGPLTLTVTDAGYSPDTRGLTVASARLSSAFANAAASGLKLQTGQRLTAEGTFSISADVAQTVAVTAPIAGWQDPPQAAGRFAFDGRFSTVGEQVTIDGKGRIDEFVFTRQLATVRQKRVDLTVAAAVDSDARLIRLTRATVDSDALTARVAGMIRGYDTVAELDLTGHYRGSWKEIMPLVHVLAPATKKTLDLTGQSEGDFTVTGPARQAKVAPSYRGVSGGTVVAWGGGKAYGLSVGAAELKAVIKDGKVTVPVTPVALGDGTARLGGTVDLAPADPLLTVPGTVQLLEKVPITAELAKELLSRINPIFADMATVEGTVSVRTRDLHLPLGESIKTAGRGAGHLDLSGLKVEPRGLLAAILKLVGQSGQGAQAIRVGGVDFAVRDGRIHYDDFTMVFADELDLKFHGSVGFDETVDMSVSVPVRAAMLERFGVKGVAAEYARLLEGARVSIPIRGTRASPALELDKVDLKPLLEKAARELLLRRVLDPATRPGPRLDPAPAPRPAEDPASGLLRDLLERLGERPRDQRPEEK